MNVILGWTVQGSGGSYWLLNTGAGYARKIHILAEVDLHHVFVKSVFGFQASLETMKKEEKGI